MDLIRSVIDRIRPVHEYSSQYFTLHYEASGMLPFTTATIRVMAFKDKEKRHRLESVEFKWFRMIEERNYQIDNDKDFYNLTVEDVGHLIIVAVTNVQSPSEVECLTFGPVVLDPAVKTAIEGIILKSTGSFEVQYPYSTLEGRIEDPNTRLDLNNTIIDDLKINAGCIVLKIRDKEH